MDLNQLDTLISQFSLTKKMPALFLGHGSPMNAIEENQFVRQFRKIATSIPKPNSIICISAHWYTNGTKVTAMNFPSTIHDFKGFPKKLYDIQYNAPGNPKLAQLTQNLLFPFSINLDHDWGLDHGTWSVIKHLYPNADIPIIQLSIDYNKSTEYHFKLAQKLQKLRERGILIIGSGNIIHNLHLLDFKYINKIDYGYDWALEAFNTLNEYLLNGNYKALIEYEKKEKFLRLAIPTPDHFLPLLYILGLQDKNENLSLFNNHLVGGSLSMTSVKIG
ncbi:4,5-DOPA-extradiol-dioxygenase [Flavobacterium oreochromis]|uniref:4,5-DOPA dioxygenase extradiol n=2 Tax=Flavobacterium TaxID=237 RepID=A0A246GC43_9FLAO|nr:4,5-DOPA dioxygenase extradiol [Flavobacterium oreochromis]OWP76757.1 4,5-DOPA dioxygenase extradiol [Flavobacterium oreochromis]OWP78069.1 4,5-DOPA dioxygenase extradiol [Flavobacterium oreochromis]